MGLLCDLGCARKPQNVQINCTGVANAASGMKSVAQASQMLLLACNSLEIRNTGVANAASGMKSGAQAGKCCFFLACNSHEIRCTGITNAASGIKSTAKAWQMLLLA